jgi:outer membrane protein assembly factor BamA
MCRLLLLAVFVLPSLAGAADRYTLVRVLVTGSQRYREDDLVRATGLNVNTQVTSDDLQNAANRLGNSGVFSSVQFLFKAGNRNKRGGSRLSGGRRGKAHSSDLREFRLV